MLVPAYMMIIKQRPGSKDDLSPFVNEPVHLHLTEHARSYDTNYHNRGSFSSIK